jgi:hypothetical protein
MADQGEAKTKTIGFLPIDKVQTLEGWVEYADKSSKLSILRTETQKAKNSVRDALKQRLNENDIDFVTEGDRIRVFRVFRNQQGRRTKSLDLSATFREQGLRPLETNGWSDKTEEGTSDETAEPIPNLDPVTERLMAIMREKGTSR